MNRFFLVVLIMFSFLGCKQNQFVEVPELPEFPFVWAYYVENSKMTYAQAFAFDDIYGDKPAIIFEDIFLDDSYDICLKKNDALLAQYEHSIYIDTFVHIIDNVGEEPDTNIFLGRPVSYNYRSEIQSMTSDSAGDSFELTVQHPDFEAMYAQQEMPQKVPIKQLELLSVALASNGFYRANIEITIDDPQEMANYYEITGAILPPDNLGNVTTQDIALRPFDIGADDPEIIDYFPIPNNSSIYLADKSFNGQTKKINFWTGAFLEPELPDDFYIIWRCVSPEWYRFFEARRASFDNPFLNNNDNLTQPYSLPFNIEGGGFGLFGVGTEEIYKVEK